MKITVLAYPNGDILITKPSLYTPVEKAMGTAHTTTRVGKINYSDGLYSVEFQLDELKCYDKSGFRSRDEAIAYEQGILDTHLAEISSVLE